MATSESITTSFGTWWRRCRRNEDPDWCLSRERHLQLSKRQGVTMSNRSFLPDGGRVGVLVPILGYQKPERPGVRTLALGSLDRVLCRGSDGVDSLRRNARIVCYTFSVHGEVVHGEHHTTSRRRARQGGEDPGGPAGDVGESSDRRSARGARSIGAQLRGLTRTSAGSALECGRPRLDASGFA